MGEMRLSDATFDTELITTTRGVEGFTSAPKVKYGTSYFNKAALGSALIVGGANKLNTDITLKNMLRTQNTNVLINVQDNARKPDNKVDIKQDIITIPAMITTPRITTIINQITTPKPEVPTSPTTTTGFMSALGVATAVTPFLAGGFNPMGGSRKGGMGWLTSGIRVNKTAPLEKEVFGNVKERAYYKGKVTGSNKLYPMINNEPIHLYSSKKMYSDKPLYPTNKMSSSGGIYRKSNPSTRWKSGTTFQPRVIFYPRVGTKMRFKF
jgi:hypothetical protein